MTNGFSYNLQDSLYCSPVNNTGHDPIQGFDAEVWVQDVCTGLLAWFGKFQSITFSIRDATETYLELGQRIPIHLNGEIQIAWVLEQGMVDLNFVHRGFGVPALRRDSYITRGPRFQISFDVNSPELHLSGGNNVAELQANGMTGNRQLDRTNSGTPSQLGTTTSNQYARNMKNQSMYRYGADEYFMPNINYAIGQNLEKGAYYPKAQGRYDLMRAKLDSVSMGAMAGRRVVALRWEGLAEGITFIPETTQQFKTRRFVNAGATGGGFVTGNSVAAAGSYSEPIFQ